MKLAKSYAPDSEPAPGFGAGTDEPFRAAFQSTQMAVLMTDPHQTENPIVFANEAFSRLTGYSRDEALGRNCRFLQGSDTDRETVTAIESAMSAGEGIETELLSYRKDGSPFWRSVVISPVHDRDGKLRYFLSLQKDVSAKKTVELELTKTKRNLEEQMDLRVQELRSALDQKTALLHEVDHRVKNNLQVISSLVLLKARRLENPENRRVLNEVAERISALSIVHRLLYSVGDVSRFDLGAVASELIPELLTALPPGQVDLQLDVASMSVPAAKAASFALLLNELAGNAIKHAFPDGRQGALTIEIGKTENGLKIAVEDNGVGLEAPSRNDGGFGRTLIDMLVRQLKGHLTWRDMKPGTRAEIVMPMDAEEIQFEYR
jgi:PAS domain S-box-containing protein